MDTVVADNPVAIKTVADFGKRVKGRNNGASSLLLPLKEKNEEKKDNENFLKKRRK